MSFLNQDFSNIQSAGTSNRLNLGYFKVKITEIVDRKSNAGYEFPDFSFEGIAGNYRGKTISTGYEFSNAGNTNSEKGMRWAAARIKAILESIGAIDIQTGKCTLKSYPAAYGKELIIKTDFNNRGFMVPTEFYPLSWTPPYEGSAEIQPPPPVRNNNSSSQPATATSLGETAEYSDDIPF